jgi:peptidoglycan/LPS O-acetylase OafA/YrhL
MSTNVTTSRDRLPELDLARFVAAIVVTFYHWTYRPTVGGVPNDEVFGALQAITRFGYLGVELFFVISGFVIFWSASNRQAASFAASRFSRLYPTFWVSMAITAGVLYGAGRTPEGFGLSMMLANITMLPGVLGFAAIDGVYWTLIVECKFYFMVLIAMLVLPHAAFERALQVWLGLTVLCFALIFAGISPGAVKVLKIVTLTPYAPLFIAGATLFLIWRSGLTTPRGGVLAVCLLLAIINAIDQEASFSTHTSGWTRAVVIAIEIGIFACFMAVALKRWSLPASPLWSLLGATTFPLYLLHNQIGKTVWWALPETLSPWLRLLAIMIVVGALTWAVTWLAERRLSPRLNAALQRAIAARRSPVAHENRGSGARCDFTPTP